MEKEYFVQQDNFIEDYKKVTGSETVDIDALADKVINQLNETQAEEFVLSGEDTKTGEEHQFPFSRRIYTNENDGTLNTEYTYEGQPYELRTDDETE
ncbi:MULTISPECIES: DUF5960 family protein [unclassified Enterococcus]|uniref:DUF5960 family protein n=1 Tax=unclassified Enterococcus TaxID=2608891 RepID=UPI001A9B0878|nr:DUF5960 family protein [Enterococcus sp. DIV1271a]MBO1301003.1 hypothetical protein [Enterococcus sp. DIV1271a]